MTTNPAILFAAAHSLLVSAPKEHLAKLYSIPLADLENFLADCPPLTWPQRLAAALGDPTHRPDLLPLLTLLARLDTQYAEADRLFRRADDFCERIREMNALDIKVLMKADAVALKAHQHSARILRDLQTAEKRYEKAQASPESANTTSRQTQSRPTTNQNSQVFTERTQQYSNESVAAVENTTDTTQDSPPAPTFPTPEEFKEIIFKHRHRIKDTPAKDRPALIARLIESEQRKNQPAAAA